MSFITGMQIRMNLMGYSKEKRKATMMKQRKIIKIPHSLKRHCRLLQWIWLEAAKSEGASNVMLQ
jgi:hypothetical protein